MPPPDPTDNVARDPGQRTHSPQLAAGSVQLDSDDLQRFIDAHGITATILPLEEQTSTVPDAARALGVTSEQIIKSLVFRIGDEAVLVINNGTARVDSRKLAAHMQVGRRKVKFARSDQALALTGYVVGSMPPFGHRIRLPTLVDTAVPGLEAIFGGGGGTDAMMRLTPSELLRVTGARVLDISE